MRAAALGVLGAAWIVALTAGSYFTTDDHLFFAQAGELDFGWDFLSAPIFDHFSPWHRLHDHVVSTLTDQGWWLAVAICVAWYAAAVALFASLVRRLVGTHPGGLLAIAAFALSPVFVQATQWWALGAQLFPQTVFTLLALLAALRWQAARRPLALAAVAAAYALALCAFVKALLLLPLLVLVLYARPGAGRPAWRREAPLWGVLALVTLAYLAIVAGERYYTSAVPAPAATLLAEYLVAGWGEGVAPLALGGTVPRDLGPGNLLVVVAANLALLALVAATARRAAVAWAAAGVVVLAALALNGGGRVGLLGVEGTALDPRYNFEAAVALMLAGAMAARAAWPAARSLRAPAAVALGLLVVVLSADAGLRREREWIGPAHRAYFESFSATLAPGIAIVDGQVPPEIVPANVAPYNQLSRLLPLREPGVRVGTLTGRPATVDARGRVVPVELEPVAKPPPGCAPLTFRLDLREPESAVVLTLSRRSDEPARAIVTADTGLPDGHLVAGFPAPGVFSTPLQLREGLRETRLVVGVGPVRTIALDAVDGTRLCLGDVRVERFGLVG